LVQNPSFAAGLSLLMTWVVKKARTINSVCPTCYRTRHFFNNFTTNEDIAMKFEADLPHCVRNVMTCAGSGHHLRPDRIEPSAPYFGKYLPVRPLSLPGSVASGTHCINCIEPLHYDPRYKTLDTPKWLKPLPNTCGAGVVGTYRVVCYCVIYCVISITSHTNTTHLGSNYCYSCYSYFYIYEFRVN